MKLCDLHTHSYFSDGTVSPTDILIEAEKIGLSAVALCDHNTVEGISEFLTAGNGSAVKVIPGIELSTDYDETELHILGLFLPTESLTKVQAYANTLLDRKEQSNRDMIARLAQDGYDVTYESIKAMTPTGKFNRSHIAAHLTEKGYVNSVKEAFDTLLAKKSSYYVPIKRVDATDAIKFLRSVGSVPVLAHPFLDLTEGQLREFLPEAVCAGLAGMEVYHPSHNEEYEQKAMELVRLYSLLPSGGSDYHGSRKPGIRLGIGEGNLQIPYAFCRDIEDYSTQI